MKLEGMDQFAAGLGKAVKSLDQFGKGASKAGQGMMRFGMQLMGFGILMVLGFVLFIWLF